LRAHPGGFRFHDAPPDVVRRALAGLLAGQVGDDEGLPERLRIDAVSVPGGHGADLARAVDHDWPDVVLGDVALGLSLAEAWERWDAEEPVWTGSGRELLDGPPRAAVVGLWWD
jgi:hypothetical protein